MTDSRNPIRIEGKVDRLLAGLAVFVARNKWKIGLFCRVTSWREPSKGGGRHVAIANTAVVYGVPNYLFR